MDVSYPQCGKTLPSGEAFSVVGLNDGLANTTNPCFSSELTWAQGASGSTSLPKTMLYVNTANPGNLGVADWPVNNIDPVTLGADVVADPYGSCTTGSNGQGLDNQACAWQYGYNLGDEDANTRGVPSARSFIWWLDVETGNSWDSNTANNDADLQGMVDYFHYIGSVAGGNVGVYSTSYQWAKIAGTTGLPGELIGLPDWIPGARNLSGAKSNCRVTPLTRGATVTVTQWTGSYDYDYDCATWT